MHGEIRLITSITTQHVVGGKVGAMTHKTTIMLLALRVGGDGLNL